MRKIGLSLVVVFALIFSNCDSGDPMPADGTIVGLTILASGNDGFSVASAGRTAGGWHSSSDSIVFTEAMLGVTRVEVETIDSAELRDHEHDGKCGHNDDGDDDNSGSGPGEGEEDADNSGPGRFANGGHGDNDDDDVVIEGEFIVDLIAGTSTPEIEFDSLDGDFIREVELKVAPILPDSNSVFIAFEVFRDSTSQLVEFSSSRMFEFEIEKKNGIPIGENPLGQILVLLHLEKLLGKIDFSRAEPDEDGVIRINDESNWNFFNLVRSRFHVAFEVGKDRDHDGDIDD